MKPRANSLVTDLIRSLEQNIGNVEVWFVLRDALEELGRLDVWRILHNRCPACGGEVRRYRNKKRPATKDLTLWRCVECLEEDVDHCYWKIGETYYLRHSPYWFRSTRELGIDSKVRYQSDVPSDDRVRQGRPRPGHGIKVVITQERTTVSNEGFYHG